MRWLVGVAWLLQTGDSCQVLSAQAGQPSVVLIALDAFHPSYLDRPVSHHLRSLARDGVRARWLVPVFPTKTFPNFYSIATGLYPENHGIVSNSMRDSVLGRFALWRLGAVRDPRWWGGEPIWVTAVRQGRRAASFFWPGSDVAIQGVRPHHYRVYDRSVPNADRVRQVLEWLSLEGEQSMSLITLYLGDVDYAGHEFGPDAPETDSAIARVDSAVGALMSGIRARGLEHRVNLVVVSDHGMARVDPRRSCIWTTSSMPVRSIPSIWDPSYHSPRSGCRWRSSIGGSVEPILGSRSIGSRRYRRRIITGTILASRRSSGP